MQSHFDIEAIREELAPSGTLRFALNHGNVVLVRRGASDETPTGVSVELARELARQLNLPLHFRHYDKAVAVTDAAGHDEWDVCFLAIDPKRAETISYSDPYVRIEGAFLVGKKSEIFGPADVIAKRPRIGVVSGSAYELHLSRTEQGGDLVVFASPEDAISALDAGSLDGLAGVRQAMERVAITRQSFGVLPEPFMMINQAVGVLAGKQAAAAFINAFIGSLKTTGFVKAALVASGHHDVTVP